MLQTEEFNFWVYISLIVIQVIILLILIFIREHIRKRDTADAVRIFRISVMIIIASVIDPVITIVLVITTAEVLSSAGLLIFLLIQAILMELFILLIIVEWNRFVDYAVYHSKDHIRLRLKRAIVVGIILSLLLVIYSFVRSVNTANASPLTYILQGGLNLIFLMQIFYVVHAVWIVLKSHKERKPPTMLSLTAFIIPLLIGYAVNVIGSFIPSVEIIDMRLFCLTIAVILTWARVEKRYKYMDPMTGLYNRQFLSSMNKYMEESGYPNGTGIFISSPGSSGGLIPVLDEIKPKDAEIFSLGEDEYLMMASEQSEAAIRWVIKSIRVGTKGLSDDIPILTGYAIRAKDESYEAFTERLLKKDSFEIVEC